MNTMTKGEKLVAEIFGEAMPDDAPKLTLQHPFLRNVVTFMESRERWAGTATELLSEIGDRYTPPNTVTKLLNKYEYEYFHPKQIYLYFHRTNRRRLIELTNRAYRG